MQQLANFLLRLLGWRTEGTVPDFKKFVAIFAPHTSAWDVVYGLLARSIFKINAQFFGKKELFRFPMGIIFRALGGIPVDRANKSNMVDFAVSVFNERETFILAMSPEGTRAHAPVWRKGFYYIALNAKVPIVMFYMDYEKKVVGVGPTFYPTGNYEKDIAEIMGYYKGIKGKHPEKGVL